MIDVLSPPTDPSLEPALIGRTNLLPQHFLPSNTSRRKVSLTLFSPQKQEVGTISCKYIAVNFHLDYGQFILSEYTHN